MNKNIFRTIATSVCIVLSINANAQYSIIHEFIPDTANKGQSPSGTLFYNGTYLYGSAGGCGIYRIKPDGSGYEEFSVPVSSGTSSLMSDGTYLYGMVTGGGSNGKGFIYKFKPDGTDYSVVYDFDGTTGDQPEGTLVYDGTYLYGMTSRGGLHNSGCVFKIKPDGSDYTKLADFGTMGISGYKPTGSLLLHQGVLYGMASGGGSGSKGTVFKINTDGTNPSDIVNFDINNGSGPQGTLITDGTYLYGMTSSGGATETSSLYYGVIFRVKLDGSDYQKIHQFTETNPSDGKGPQGDLALDGTYLYGFTVNGGDASGNGTIFKLKTDGSDYTQLHQFGVYTGIKPNWCSPVIVGESIYGVASQLGPKGPQGKGVVFKYNAGISTNGISSPDKKGFAFEIYPNPAKETVTISKITVGATVKITDIMGRMVYKSVADKEQITVNAKGFVNGIYMVQVQGSGVMANRKIVISR